MDLFTAKDQDLFTSYSLVVSLIRQLGRNGVPAIFCYVPDGTKIAHDSLAFVLRVLGFVRYPDGISTLLVRAHSDPSFVEQLQSFGHWEFRAGDTDWI